VASVGKPVNTIAFLIRRFTPGGAGQRIFVGMLIGFSFYIFSQLVSQLGQVYGMHPLLAMLLPISLFMFYGVRAMRRV